MNRKALSLAVGAAVVFGAAQQAQADELLFPFFQSGAGSWTFLSLRSDGGNLNPGTNGVANDPADDTIAYVFNYDDPVTGPCTHFDVQGSMTDYDIIQQTVVDPAFSGLDLASDFGDQSTANYLPIAGATSGFLTVRDNSGEAQFGGQAIIVDAAAGVATAYRGINDPLDGAPTPANNPNTTGNFDTLLVTSHPSHDFTWYPVGVVSTSWFVLVTGSNMDKTSGWDGQIDMALGFGGAFDRDENFLSGGRTPNVVCYGTLTPGHLLNTAQASGAELGGWAWVINTPVANNDATGALVYKFETTGALGGTVTTISEENPFPNLF